MNTPIIHIGKVSRVLLLGNIAMSFIYFSWWFFPDHIANIPLYSLLFLGEIYHMIMALTFWYTIWPGKQHQVIPDVNFTPTIDVFIPVAGEPLDIIRETAIAARDMIGYEHNVYILNDGYVAKKDTWKDVEKLASQLHIFCITRKKAHGAKAGNINNALRYTKGKIIIIFDADMAPHPDFLKKTISYFQDEKTGFVQTPQYYKNHSLNDVSSAAWAQQELYFGPILQGKEKSNAVTINGTNVAIRRKALEEVGGMVEENIAEDFLTSLFIHQKGWNAYYVPEVLAEGLAPEDLQSYYKQQLRWARGNLEVLFSHNPLFQRGLTFGQKIQYLSSSLYYVNGVVVLIDIVMPIIFLFTGIQAVAAATTSFALFFMPFMFLNLYTLYRASGKSITFRAISFSQSSWTLQVHALESILAGSKMGFAVTPKKAQQGNFLSIAYPHMIYVLLAMIAMAVGIHRDGLNPSVVTNIAWAMFNSTLFSPFIFASLSGVQSSKPLQNETSAIIAGETV